MIVAELLGSEIYVEGGLIGPVGSQLAVLIQSLITESASTLM